MSVVVLLIAAGGFVAAGFLAAFAWAVQSGQYDDTCTPAVRLLLDERHARVSAANEPAERSEPANRRASDAAGLEGRSPSKNEEGLFHVDSDH